MIIPREVFVIIAIAMNLNALAVEFRLQEKLAVAHLFHDIIDGVASVGQHRPEITGTRYTIQYTTCISFIDVTLVRFLGEINCLN